MELNSVDYYEKKHGIMLWGRSVYGRGLGELDKESNREIDKQDACTEASTNKKNTQIKMRKSGSIKIIQEQIVNQNQSVGAYK